MLLPSALSCDLRRSSRFTPIRSFATPPPSDDDGPPGNGLLGTCRALQSLLNGSPAPSSRRAKPERLQSPLNLRLAPTPSSSTRSRKAKETRPSPTPYSRPSRGANKRTRDCYEEDNDISMRDADISHSRPSTPKRPRNLPFDLPLGLSHSDFYSLHSPPVTQSPPSSAQRREPDRSEKHRAIPSYDPDAVLPSIEESEEPAPAPADDSAWTAEDDQRLVETVLEKFKLSKQDWDECARLMGKDHASVGQRWQALVGEGNVGLRRGRRMVRSRIHKDWM
ncbi:hypothetical protein P175DRAFT_0509799 [Aspergillus ochraceoroseus IBT 24754]|uniref:Myb-like domain-containing protein n=3 Tax=Aspergillus subgen. Nidulantes TaxID=2720870 RepID=A0A0F8UR69_9EURO|nr:uncharacterized protein P175DRAFT_0509799 [Aspergillus ochraceoroseus IBT 24754]KKK18270.1 hypothetical protein AOCH_001562 [Aspergillus ochraceoroseus]KKK21978.1 hypothetical protein ARAM_006583 [Aspergillus rambellii]PTU19794.1 hypothetical protein P175DRAFT_0509799 [Aspergillus ochraceoroseus IBT 24754]